MTSIFKRIAAPVAIAACLGLGAGAANAGALTFQGVTFTTSFSGNVLTLEIDAATPTGDWATATTLGMLGIKDVGSFDSVALTSAPAGALSWIVNNNELNANGCTSGSNPMKLCAFGSHVALTDDMVFEFTFTGGTQNFTSPHLKVGLYEGNDADKVGSLLSENIPAVPEPATYGMLLAGLAMVGAVARKRAS
ncbi:PEP-CTERM sorting domain-containing protein [Pseudoduganella sp. LjRoot289]|uniref:PEP-CTERM sorting domain-containing protein n=1 Tax=Pseudoduganella sp. LjRoot289 TaxID=3342314 RepID=UPI003ECCF026